MQRLVILVFLASAIICVSAVSKHQADIEDNDFAEFEEFDEDVVPKQQDTSDQKKSPPEPLEDKSESEDPETEGVVEDEDDTEFEHFQDEEEFEGFDQDMKPNIKTKQETPDLKITKVPLHLSTSWESFYLEILMLVGLIVYFLNFFLGRSKNQSIANAWFESHKELLEENFVLIGDDGKPEAESAGLVKQSENVYALWCSGRSGCEGMFVELRLLKRQDLVHVIAQMFKPSNDQIIVKLMMNAEDMDSFVFALANKKTGMKTCREMADISTFCPEKKNVDRFGLPNSFVLFNEIGEAASAILDSKVVTVLTKFEEYIEYVHFSDQFSGPKAQESDTQQVKPVEASKVLIFAFNVPKQGKAAGSAAMKEMKQLFQMVFYCVDKMKKFKLSKEAKSRAEKSRQKVEEAFMKNTHQQRVEAAQIRREEKRRQEKERILMEDDPDKQRKWEEREYRRELKKRAPKIKQLKVKAL